MLYRNIALLLLPLTLLGGCSSYDATPAAAYVNFWDRMRVRFPMLVSGPLCGVEKSYKGMRVIEPIPDDQCYKFRPAEQISGIWIDEFEGQKLLTEAEYRGRDWYSEAQRDRWLAVPWRLVPAHDPAEPKPYEARAFRVTFVGRRTLYDGSYGHMGASNELILMDRFVKIEPVERLQPNSGIVQRAR